MKPRIHVEKKYLLRKHIELIFICEHSFPDGSAQSTRIKNMVIGISGLVLSVTVFAKYYLNDDDISWRSGVTIIPSRFENIKKRKSFIKFIIDKLFSIKIFNELIKYQCKQESTFVYLSTASPLTLLGVFLVCRFKGYRLLTDLGEWFPWPASLMNLASFSYFRHVVFRWMSIRLSNYIVAISSSIKSQCVDSGVAVIIIPSIAPYRDDSADILTTRKGNFFYAGILKKEDGFGNLLLALYKLFLNGYNINLTTCGGFSEDAIKGCCISCGIPESFAIEKVKHLFWLPNTAYRSLLQSSSLVLMPRPLEHAANITSFPTRLAEALSFAAPVAIANVGDVRNYLTPNIDFLDLGLGTSEEIYFALKSWLDNPQAYQDMGLNGYFNSRKYFDVDINMTRLIEFII